jgi:hypothetical protein
MPLMSHLGTTLLIVAIATLVLPAQAAENAKLTGLDTSLNRVPDDVSFYYGKFRTGEQIEKIGKSRAWAKLMESPAVQLALKTYETQKEDPNSPAAQAALMLEDAQTQDMLQLLADMFDDEAFLYADQSLVKTLSFLQKLQRLSHREFGHNKKEQKELYKEVRKIIEQIQETSDPEEKEALFEKIRELHSKENRQTAKPIYQFAAQNLDALTVPSVIFGSKLSDTKRAELNMGKLEFILSMGVMGIASQHPDKDFQGVLSRREINGGKFLVVTITGDMIPWEENHQLMRIAKNDENVRKVIEKLKKEKLVIAIGVQGDYLLASIGPSLDELKKFGQGTPLVTRAEMTRIEPYVGKPITEITYWSKALTTLNFAYKKDADIALKHAAKALEKEKFSQKDKDQILVDLTKIAKEVKGILPEPGAISSVCYMTPTGQEQYVFSWAIGGPAEQPLELINHLGGSPILGLVVSFPLDVETYDMVVGWGDIFWGYFKKYGIPHMPEEKQAKTKEAIELFGPIVAEIHKINREMFLPAFGGEVAIQLDAELTLSTLPEVNQEMPMLEPAIILAVKDRDLMEDALDAYWEAIGDALEVAKTKCDKMANAKMPKYKEVEGKTGTKYIFRLPKKCPVHTEVKPTVGIGKDTLVFAMTPEAAERLMKETPLTYGGVLTDAKKPRVVAGCFAWDNLVTSATPWVMFAVEEGLKKQDQKSPLTPEAIRTQFKTILEVLSVVKNVTVESYYDGNVTIKHSQVKIEDID